MTTIELPRHRRGVPFEPQGAGGYHVGWYAIARSADVPAGQVIGVDLFNGRVIVFRGEDGEVRVMGAYCRHFGADLSVGEVIGNDVRCAFHHWQYGPDGACTNIPAGDRIPNDARLFQYASAERFGMIWAYNGDTPTELPHFPGYDTDTLVFKVGDRADHFPVEPWVIFTNSIDVQHLRVVHRLKVECDLDTIEVGDHTIDYDLVLEDANLGVMRQHMKVFGTSAVLVATEIGGVDLLIGATAAPKPDGGCVHIPFVAAVRDDSSPEAAQAVDARLTMGLEFAYGLLKDDVAIMRSIHAREDLLLPADRALVRYLRYARNFPRANPGCEFIC